MNKKRAWMICAVLMLLVVVSPVIAYAATLTSPPITPPKPQSHVPLPTNVNCPNPCTITINNSVYGNGQPAVIAPGTTVVWHNADSTQHTTTSDTGLWGSKILNPGNTFSFAFSTLGTYAYHCEIHPMTGEIIVISP